MIVAIPTVEAYVATVNIASELTSGKIRHGAEMIRNLRIKTENEIPGETYRLLSMGLPCCAILGLGCEVHLVVRSRRK
jgi:hypothetical protein